MPEQFSLVRRAWLPVALDDGRREFVRPCDITQPHDGRNIMQIATGRPDCDIALTEFLIGLLAVGIGPADRREWAALWSKPPSAAVLEAAFATFEVALILDGDAARVFQDREALDGEPNAVEALLIDAPGANANKENADHFVKRERTSVFSRAGAAIALATLQTAAPSGGAGHRTSLRGGGPLTTLVVPGGEAGEQTFWQRLWTNVPLGMKAAAADSARIFPWLAPTRISDRGGKKTTPSDVNAAQCFFGMPRRIRLVFEANTTMRPCDLLGIVDDIIVTGYVTRPWGTNYTDWSRGHPLSPYYKMKDSDPEFLPLHLQSSRVGYRQWLGMTMEAEKGLRVPARCIAEFRQKAGELARSERAVWQRSRLLVAGYAMDNMKPLDFAEAELPLILSPDDAVYEATTVLARAWIEAADSIAIQLASAIKLALYGDSAKVKHDSTVLESVKARFWADTESDFYDKLRKAAATIEAHAETLADQQGALRQEAGSSWLATLRRKSLAIFDDTVPIEDATSASIEDIIAGRKMVLAALSGQSKAGVALFKLLDQKAVETKPGRGGKRK